MAEASTPPPAHKPPAGPTAPAVTWQGFGVQLGSYKIGATACASGDGAGPFRHLLNNIKPQSNPCRRRSWP